MKTKLMVALIGVLLLSGCLDDKPEITFESSCVDMGGVVEGNTCVIDSNIAELKVNCFGVGETHIDVYIDDNFITKVGENDTTFTIRELVSGVWFNASCRNKTHTSSTPQFELQSGRNVVNIYLGTEERKDEDD